MRKHLKKHFIPHEENDYKPHFLRGASVAVLTLILFALFFASFIHVSILVSDSDFLAAVLPAVLVDLTNEERDDEGLTTLEINPVLTEAARLKAQDMAEDGYFEHNSPDGLTPWHWFYEAGYQFSHAGENLAVNFSDSDEVVEAWMDSPGHRANILNGNFTQIGIATAEGELDGRRTIFVVQMFGRPLASVQGATTAEDDSSDEQEVAVLSEGPTGDPNASENARASGDEENVAPTNIENLEVTDVVEKEDSLYIAVRDPNVEENAVVDETEGVEEGGSEVSTSSVNENGTGTPPVAIGSTGVTPKYSNFLDKILTQPHKTLNYTYLFIGFLVVLSLLLSIFIEIKRQHPMQIAYGVLLLLLIFGLTYLNKVILFSNLQIV